MAIEAQGTQQVSVQGQTEVNDNYDQGCHDLIHQEGVAARFLGDGYRQSDN